MTDDTREKVAEHLLALLPLYHKKIFRPESDITGIQAAQHRVLGVLMREGPLPMSELGRRLYISRPYMTALVDRLIDEGYAERHPDARDRRVINVTITDSGRSFLKYTGTRYKNHIKKLLANLNTGDLEDLCTSLGKLREILSRVTPEEL
jgi:DNA-binding MarR family transcriptional regulator